MQNRWILLCQLALHFTMIVPKLVILVFAIAATLGFLAEPAKALDLSAPTLDANVTVQAQRFDGDNFGVFGGYADGPVSKYSLRHATLGLEGRVGETIDYELRAGAASCFAGGAFTILDIGVFYRPAPFLRLGFKQGEIMRGFELNEECVKLLTAEKPRFAKSFAPCHPLGAVVEITHEFDDVTGIELQIAYLNGSGQDLDSEHDFNTGFQFHTPMPGLSIAGFFSAIRKNYGPDPGFQMVNDPGTRFGFGVDYDQHNTVFRGEYYQLTGFYNDPFNNTLYETRGDPDSYIKSADLEMTAWFVETGYTITTGLSALPAVQPYLRYQAWDKGVNADGDHLYTYLTAGLTLFLDEERRTSLRIDYEEQLDISKGQSKDASLLIIRLQADVDWTPEIKG